MTLCMGHNKTGVYCQVCAAEIAVLGARAVLKAKGLDMTPGEIKDAIERFNKELQEQQASG